jgi:hypothetical protein
LNLGLHITKFQLSLFVRGFDNTLHEDLRTSAKEHEKEGDPLDVKAGQNQTVCQVHDNEDETSVITEKPTY